MATYQNDSAVPMDFHEKSRLRGAAFRATRLYPGPVGELISIELLTWEEFGWRLGDGGLVKRLVDHVMNAKAEDTPAPPYVGTRSRPATKSAVGY